MIQYVKDQEGGDRSGKKIALVYFDGAYGKEPIPTLERLSKEEGFTFRGFPVASPGLEQKATWLQIGRQFRPDWTLMRSEEHTSELQSLMRISYAVFCLKKKKKTN